MHNKKVACSFSMEREICNAYKNVVVKNVESGKDNIIKYMQNVINNETPNAETIEAIKEIERLKADPNKKTYSSFAEIMRDDAD